MKFASLLVFVVGVLHSAVGAADERILRYHSDVVIHATGELTVTEEIRVRAEGNEIQRGIYREFPTRYRDRLGNHYRVQFTVISVLRDGAAEPWHTKNMRNGLRLYIGDRDHFLDPGVYTYQIRFSSNRQGSRIESQTECIVAALEMGPEVIAAGERQS